MKLFKMMSMIGLMVLKLSEVFSSNQTDTLSPMYSEEAIPFSVEISSAHFSLPSGLQSYVGGIYKDKWLLLTGRTNGMHGFSDLVNNFPLNLQNTEIFLVDPSTGQSKRKSLYQSDLSQEVIDLLSVTAARVVQKNDILYLVGGYGINTGTGEMETKPTLTAIDLKELTNWVLGDTLELKHAIRTLYNPYFQLTGGGFFQLNDHHPMLLPLGQNFTGLYRDDSNGEYLNQIRAFWLNDDGKNLSILPLESSVTYPTYRRRDLNIVPILYDNNYAYIAFSGVFTLTTGIWTLPITIYPDGSSVEMDVKDPNAFKQPMNHYNCPSFGLYSSKNDEMYVVFPGGISYGLFENGTFVTDAELPFINQVSTIKIDKDNQFTQHLMNGEYPYLISTGSNPGNQLIFGAEAIFFPKNDLSVFANGVIQLDALTHEPTVIGYIVGGIMSTVPNTSGPSDTTASPYVFAVTIKKK